MADKINLARELSTTTGQGTLTLEGAPDGWFTFIDAGAVSGRSYRVLIQEGNNRELVTGTFTDAGSSVYTFSRDTVIQSLISGTAGTAKIDLQGGAVLTVVGAAEDFVDLNINDFGAFGSQDPDSLVDETTEIAAALNEACATGRTLYIPYAHYQGGEFLRSTAFNLHVRGEASRWPVFHPTQAVADDASGELWRFTRGNYTSDDDVSSLGLAAAIRPFQQTIPFDDVTGLEAGMVLQITSDRLWYYDNRSIYVAGEIHLITKVLADTNEVVIEDYVRDEYDDSADTLYIRAWWPDRIVLENLAFEFPEGAVGASTRALVVDRTLRPMYRNLRFQGMTQSGILDSRSIWANFIDIEVNDIGRETTPGGVASAGYGLQYASDLYPTFTRIKSRGSRRAIEGSTLSSAEIQAPSRDVIIRDPHILGGGFTSGLGNILSEPDFDATGDWVTTSRWTITGGQAVRDGAGTGNMYQPVDEAAYLPGESAVISVDVAAITGRIRFRFYTADAGSALGSPTDWIDSTGEHTIDVDIPPTAGRFYILAEDGTVTCTLNSLHLDARSMFFPEGDAPNYGIGGHGPIENLQILGGYIANCKEGINSRSRNTIIEGVTFAGRMTNCVNLTYGTGGLIRDNAYLRDDWPDKVASGDLLIADMPESFVKLSGSDAATAWTYDSPLVIEGNVAHGLRYGFLHFGTATTQSVENIVCRNNTALIRSGSGETFEFFKAPGTVNISESCIGPNTIRDIGAGTLVVRPTNLVLGSNVSVPELERARAWAHTTNDTVVAGHNVSAVVDDDVDEVTLTLSITMPSTAYAVLANSTDGVAVRFGQIRSQTTTAIVASFYNAAISNQSPSSVNWVVFGDV